MTTTQPPRRALLSALGLTAAMLALAPLRATAHGALEHKAALKSGSAYKRSITTYAVPDVVLTDADERPVRLRDLLASKDPVMVNFTFTTCSTICPVMTKVFSEVPARLGSDARQLRMISISLDPENDTPLQLKAYARSLRATERWKFLTGPVDDIKSVLLAFDTYRGNKMNHEPVTLIRPAHGKSWVRIDGFASPDELVDEFRRASPL